MCTVHSPEVLGYLQLLVVDAEVSSVEQFHLYSIHGCLIHEIKPNSSVYTGSQLDQVAASFRRKEQHFLLETLGLEKVAKLNQQDLYATNISEHFRINKRHLSPDRINTKNSADQNACDQNLFVYKMFKFVVGNMFIV